MARQTVRDFEIILIDAASPDRTVEVVQSLVPSFPIPLRLEVAPTRISVGAARNRGVILSRAPLVAFMSADAEADPRWVERALRSLETYDIVFGQQLHAPMIHNVATAVRGLRYHFPEASTTDPLRYASHVNAAFRRRVLESFPFGEAPGASAIDDILLAHRSAEAGFRAAYDPIMIVRHHDIESWRAELTKNRREGLGLGEFVHELGVQRDVLMWAALLAATPLLLLVAPWPLALAAFLLVLWAPALRRGWRRRQHMAGRDVVRGVVASPFFDLAFLFAYLQGLVLGRGHPPKQPGTPDKVQT